MVHIPTRGTLPARVGPQIQTMPDYGPSKMSRQPYTDPVQYELEREHVLNKHWLSVRRQSSFGQISVMCQSSFSQTPVRPQ